MEKEFSEDIYEEDDSCVVKMRVPCDVVQCEYGTCYEIHLPGGTTFTVTEDDSGLVDVNCKMYGKATILEKHPEHGILVSIFDLPKIRKYTLQLKEETDLGGLLTRKR